MTILGMNGAPLPGAKKDHHPERVEKERVRLSQALAEQKKKWKGDNQPDPAGATEVNQLAVDEFHAQQFRTVALAATKGQEALEVNPEAMAKWIAEERKNEWVRTEMVRPLKEVRDLSSWDFKLVGVGPFGTVWLCDRVALAVAEEGMVLLLLRPTILDMAGWADTEWLGTNTWDGLAHELPDLTLGELHTLLKVLRYTKLVALPEALMRMARATQPEGARDPGVPESAQRVERPVTAPTGTPIER